MGHINKYYIRYSASSSKSNTSRGNQGIYISRNWHIQRYLSLWGTSLDSFSSWSTVSGITVCSLELCSHSLGSGSLRTHSVQFDQSMGRPSTYQWINHDSPQKNNYEKIIGTWCSQSTGCSSSAATSPGESSPISIGAVGVLEEQEASSSAPWDNISFIIYGSRGKVSVILACVGKKQNSRNTYRSFLPWCRRFWWLVCLGHVRFLVPRWEDTNTELVLSQRTNHGLFFQARKHGKSGVEIVFNEMLRA